MSKSGTKTDRQEAETVAVLWVEESDGSLAAAVGNARDRFQVTRVKRAQAALDRLETEQFDCILSSTQLPEMDGLELFEVLREREISIPFILHTDEETSASEGFAAGISSYVRGDQPTVLANRIESEVDSYRKHQQAQVTTEALEEIRDGVAIFDAEGQFQYVNEAYASFYGYRPAELVGEGWEQLYPESERERYRNTIIPTLQSEGGWIGTCECLHRDGFRFRTTHSISRLDDGGHVCVIHSGSVSASEN